MRAELWVAVAVVVVTVSQSAPVEKSNKQLDDLKHKLSSLEKELKSLQGNIEDYVTGDEDAGKSQEKIKPQDKKPVKTPAKTAAKDGAVDRKLRGFEDSLSEDDKNLLQRFQSQVEHLQAALKAPIGPLPDDVDTERMETRSQDSELESFINTLTSEDQSLLKRVHSKLSYLQTELHKADTGLNPGDTVEETSNEKRNMLEKQRNQNKEPTQLLHDVRVNLDKLRGALDRYASRKAVNEPGCQGENCNQEVKSETSKQVLDDVSRKFLNDVNYAKSRGVNLKDLISALESAKIKRGLPSGDEEQQLEGLAHLKH